MHAEGLKILSTLPMSTSRTVLSGILAPAVVLSACVPVVRNQFPTITGSVVDGTQIPAHAEILIIRHPSRDCSDHFRIAQVDEKGNFVLPGNSTVELAYPGGETESDWTLCVRSNGSTYFGLWYFTHSSPDSLQVRCDLKRVVKENEPESGVCALER